MSDETKNTNVGLLNVELPEFADKAAQNLTDKPTQAIGQTLAELWQLFLGGRTSLALEKQKIKYAHDLEEYRKSLEQKVSAIPEEKQIDPPLQVAAQAMDDSKYCVESKELRELFANLIANSMNVDYAEFIHPSFSKIIQQMSPLDANMLKIIRQHGGIIAIANYRRKINNNRYELLMAYIPAQMPTGCTPELASRAIVSLERQGLINIPADEHFTNDQQYDSLKRNTLYHQLEQKVTATGSTLDMQKHIARLTPFGQDFLTVCCD